MGVPLRTEEELEALKRGSDGEWHNALLNAQKWGMYGVCVLLFIFAAAVTISIIYIMACYVGMLAASPEKLETAVTHSLSFVFGGGTLATIMALRSKLPKKRR